MKKIIKMILLGFILNTCLVHAASINIFNNDNNAEIYLNKKLIGRYQVLNYNVEPGSYLLEIKTGNDLIHSEIIDVKEGILKTVSTDNFVKAKSVLVDASSEKPELERSLKSKGNIGFGFNVGSLPGVSLALRAKYIGVELTGLHSKSGDEYSYVYEIRGKYYIKDKLLKKMPATLYFSTGYGEWSYDNGWSSHQKKHADAMLGVEFSLGNENVSPWVWFNPMLAIMGTLMTLDNMYINLDIGYGWSDNDYNTNEETLGMVGRMGLKLYF